MEGLIRKIVLGQNPKDAMAYYVGMRAGSGEVSAIVYDDKHLHRFNRSRYLVYIQTDDGVVLWKAIEDLPCVVEYDLNF
jgi:hypothetical protein